MSIDHDLENKQIELHITELAKPGIQLEILEAGCGQAWPLNLAGIEYRLTGVDLDAEAMKIRVDVVKDLDEAIISDLRELNLGERKFDVIYNSFVLEHVQDASVVMNNFDRLLSVGGLLILRIPDRDSVFGFITRHTPFWFHVFYKKFIQGRENAGKPGHAPYPTFYEKIVSRAGIHDFCSMHGYEIKFENKTGDYIKRKTLKIKLVKIFAIAISCLSFGRLPWEHNNLTYVLKKK